MSSIYRKGRDGYFYYQTYVKNPETGKKDKKLFHSLGTKNEHEAKEKQKYFDLKYESKEAKIKKISTWPTKNLRDIILVCGTSILTLVISNTFSSSSSLEKKINASSTLKGQPNMKLIQKPLEVRTITNVKPKLTRKMDVQNVAIKNKNTSPKKTEEIQVPSYKIERLERLSGAFKQGKIYLTVEDHSDTKSLKYICENVLKEYSEFSNVIICVYSSDSAGKFLATGHESKVSLQEKKQSWLAMYTFNDVEGAYFDDNPTGYLNNY